MSERIQSSSPIKGRDSISSQEDKFLISKEIKRQEQKRQNDVLVASPRRQKDFEDFALGFERPVLPPSDRLKQSNDPNYLLELTQAFSAAYSSMAQSTESQVNDYAQLQQLDLAMGTIESDSANNALNQVAQAAKLANYIQNMADGEQATEDKIGNIQKYAMIAMAVISVGLLIASLGTAAPLEAAALPEEIEMVDMLSEGAEESSAESSLSPAEESRAPSEDETSPTSSSSEGSSASSQVEQMEIDESGSSQESEESAAKSEDKTTSRTDQLKKQAAKFRDAVKTRAQRLAQTARQQAQRAFQTMRAQGQRFVQTVRQQALRFGRVVRENGPKFSRAARNGLAKVGRSMAERPRLIKTLKVLYGLTTGGLIALPHIYDAYANFKISGYYSELATVQQAQGAPLANLELRNDEFGWVQQMIQQDATNINGAVTADSEVIGTYSSVTEAVRSISLGLYQAVT